MVKINTSNGFVFVKNVGICQSFMLFFGLRLQIYGIVLLKYGEAEHHSGALHFLDCIQLVAPEAMSMNSNLVRHCFGA